MKVSKSWHLYPSPSASQRTATTAAAEGEAALGLTDVCDLGSGRQSTHPVDADRIRRCP